MGAKAGGKARIGAPVVPPDRVFAAASGNGGDDGAAELDPIPQSISCASIEIITLVPPANDYDR